MLYIFLFFAKRHESTVDLIFNIHIYFYWLKHLPVSQCRHIAQKLTEAESIFGDICHQQCMTVEKSV